MDRVDLLIIVVLIYVVVRGMRIGFLELVGSTVGLISGLLIGSLLSVQLSRHLNTPAAKAILILSMEGVLAIGMSYLGEYLGHIWDKKLSKPVLKKLNEILGAPFEALSLLLVVWIVASGIANTQALNLGYYTRHSLIVKTLDRALPPPPDFIARLEKIVSPNGFPNVFVGLEPQHTVVPVNSVVSQQVIAADENSVVKVLGSGCGGTVEGSGVVVGNGIVLTNSHVIAGTRDTEVIDTNGTYDATPIWFDPNLDIAVLSVGGLQDNPLTLSNQTYNSSIPGAVLGYPGNGPLVVGNAVVLDQVFAEGQNIYNQGTVYRNIYEVQADINPGNSGGALINASGSVIGIVFAKSVSQPNVGYALVTSDLISSVQAAERQNTAVSVGQCASL